MKNWVYLFFYLGAIYVLIDFYIKGIISLVSVLLLTIGTSSNIFTVILNKGKMPVGNKKGISFKRNENLKRHVFINENSKLKCLGDIFSVRLTKKRGIMMSIGDILILIGLPIVIIEFIIFKGGIF